MRTQAACCVHTHAIFIFFLAAGSIAQIVTPKSTQATRLRCFAAFRPSSAGQMHSSTGRAADGMNCEDLVAAVAAAIAACFIWLYSLLLLLLLLQP